MPQVTCKWVQYDYGQKPHVGSPQMLVRVTGLAWEPMTRHGSYNYTPRNWEDYG